MSFYVFLREEPDVRCRFHHESRVVQAPCQRKCVLLRLAIHIGRAQKRVVWAEDDVICLPLLVRP
eukprot:SAG11_NODE_8_length_31217_cov_52.169677_7_plen_65_part_00